MRIAAMVSLFCYAAIALRLAVRADVICSHWMLPSGLIGALLSRLTGKPHIVVEHSGALHLLRRMRGGRWLARLIVGLSHRIVTVSGDLKKKLIALCPEAEAKTEVIPMGVRVIETPVRLCPCSNFSRSFRNNLFNQGRPETVAPTDRNILFIGRLVEIKGVDVLLRAMKQVEGLQLTIAGDGQERERLERLANQMGIDARFLGRVDIKEKNRLLSACRALVIPSLVLPDGRTEGMPVVCLEAMAAGLPVIASRAGGLEEIISDRQDGLLFDAGDHFMLAEKIKLISGDIRLRETISVNARAKAAGFDWPIVASRFSDILKNALRENEHFCNDAIESGSAD
jgi:glycosyltransferase involved in cell wall biosynthesis